MKLNTIITNEEIEKQIAVLGEKISREMDGEILCVCVLRGAFMFFSQLVKHIRGNVTVDFITVSSYMGDKPGELQLVGDIRERIEGRNVLIVEDIVDSGRTIEFLRKYFGSKNAASVKVACLIDKPENREVQVPIDYTAFCLDKKSFLVGYGLDLDQSFRNLDYIAEVKFD